MKKKSIYFLIFLNFILTKEVRLIVLVRRTSFIISSFLWSPLLINTNIMTKRIRIDYSTVLLLVLLLINFLACRLREYRIKKEEYNFQIRVIILTRITALFFLTETWVILYIWFEMSLIPIFFIILGWGYQRERLIASKALIFYTISSSMPLLLILALHFNLRYSHLFQIETWNLSRVTITLARIRIRLGFLVKLPICFFHIWLPKAHVEAPVTGSIFLAAILLKMGGFGLIKIMPLILPINFFNSIIVRITLWGFVIINLICIQRSDIKVLIAFSSVSHIGIALLCLITGVNIGLKRILIIILGHGIRSSLIFFYSYLLYLTSSTRRLLLNKSLKLKIGLFRIIWCMSCVGILGGPPTINLWFEITAFFIIRRTLIIRLKFLFWAAFLTGIYRLICISAAYSGNQAYNQTNFITTNPINIINSIYHIIFLLRLIFFFFRA